MPGYEVDPEQVERVILEGHHHRIRGVVEAIQRTVAVHGPKIAQEEVDATRPYPPVDRADYRRRFEVFDIPHGSVFVNTSAHAQFVEGGRGPGRWPPRDAIERWVRRKFRLQLTELARARKTSRSALDRAYRGLAFVIARKIALRGIPGKYVMRRVEARLTPVVRDAVLKAAGGAG